MEGADVAGAILTHGCDKNVIVVFRFVTPAGLRRANSVFLACSRAYDWHVRCLRTVPRVFKGLCVRAGVHDERPTSERRRQENW